MSDDNLFEHILDKVQNFLASKGIEIVSEKTLMSALPLVIECVDTIKTKGVTGEDKKSLVLRVILFIVRESSLDDEKKELLRKLIESEALETTIDIIIATSKGEFKLNQKNKRALFVCMSQCFQLAAESIEKVHKPSLNIRGLTGRKNVSATVEAVADAAEETVTAVVEEASATVEAVADAAEETVTAVVEEASATVEAVADAAEETVTAVVEEATATVEAVADAAEETVTAVVEEASATVEAVADAAEETVTAVVEEPLPELPEVFENVVMTQSSNV